MVFSRRNFEKHKKKHPELRIGSFCPKRIIKTLQNPTFTIKSIVPHALCYYYEEYSSNGIMRYTKVIVHEEQRAKKESAICFVKTAFRIDHIQEIKYGFQPAYHRKS